MLITKGDKEGYLWDTISKTYVKDPNFTIKRIQEAENNSPFKGLDVEKLLGISPSRPLTVDTDIKYLITEEEYNLATPDSVDLVTRAYTSIKDSIRSGVLPEHSFLFSIGHKAKVVDLSATFLLNAHVGGLSIDKIHYLKMMNKYDLTRLDKDLTVIIAPHIPTEQELSTLITILEYRDQMAKPTIVITSKYSTHPYRLVTTTQNEKRMDLMYLVCLKQERTVENLEGMAKGLDFSFKKVKNKYRALVEQPDNEQIQNEYDKATRSAFVDIAQSKAVNVSKSLFDIGKN